MATGVIGLGNIGGAIAANLVADGNDVVVHDVDTGGDVGDHRRDRRAGRRSVARQADVTLLSLPTPDVVADVAECGRPRPRRMRSSSTCPPTARPSCASWAPPGRVRASPGRGAADRRGHRRREADARVHGRRRGRAPSPGSFLCSSRSGGPRSTSARSASGTR